MRVVGGVGGGELEAMASGGLFFFEWIASRRRRGSEDRGRLVGWSDGRKCLRQGVAPRYVFRYRRCRILRSSGLRAIAKCQ